MKYFIITSIFFISGCTRGILYTDVVRPLTRNMNNTPVGSSKASSSTKRVSEPFSALSISTEWSSRAIGDAALRKGLSEIYFADMRTQSYFLGIWQKKTVQVYGRE